MRTGEAVGCSLLFCALVCPPLWDVKPSPLSFFDNAVPGLPTNSFSEVEKSYLNESDWKFVYADRWHRKENILKTEGRAMLWAARHKLRKISNFDKKHVLLADSLSYV